jgi:hypothetical protein
LIAPEKPGQAAGGRRQEQAGCFFFPHGIFAVKNCLPGFPSQPHRTLT